jgi:hypothetical protein
MARTPSERTWVTEYRNQATAGDPPSRSGEIRRQQEVTGNVCQFGVESVADRFKTIEDVGLVLLLPDVQCEVAVINFGIFVKLEGKFGVRPKRLADLGANAG